MNDKNLPIISEAVAPTEGVIPDPIQAGLQSGWKVTDASKLDHDQAFEADVVVIGSGAGGGVTAETLAKAGLKVLIIEEGALKSSRDFKMREAEAYPSLYQESAARKTKDKAINILQGRTVGGSTTVNWTSSFRTPEPTLAFWQQRFGLKDYAPEALDPWFTMMEQRLNVSRWMAPPNENNDLLRRGADKLGIPTAAIKRNVRGCWNLGYCGMGCPTNAKQSMLVTTIPSALNLGASLLTRARAEKLVIRGDQIDHLLVTALDASGQVPTGRVLTVRAKHFVLSGGAINSPGLLLRSDAPNPHGLLGTRTFLHPTTGSLGLYDHEVKGYQGAPQSIYSDHFLGTQAIDGPLGYKLEAPPLHPVLFATTMAGFGAGHADVMRQFANTHVLLALLRDGFHADSQGGTVGLRDDGSPVLDYPLNDVIWDGVKRALLTMAEIQFASGAREVQPVHEMSARYKTWKETEAAIHALPFEAGLGRVVSAHVMGGCGMSDDERLGVVSSTGRYHGLRNLSVHDGSVFPTSIGANPQLSIYGITSRLAAGLVKDLTGKAAPPLTASS